MPTGYTAAIKDGISFEKYAMDCARAFGACVTLRDKPSEPIPDEFQPSDYHAKAAQAARGKLAELMALTPEQRERKAVEAWNQAEERRLERLQDRTNTRNAYEAMLAKVKAWEPPTPAHLELHRFMQSQIEQSIEFDCSGDYGTTPSPRLSGEQWAAQGVESLNRDIAYHEKEHAEEVDRAAKRTQWVRALRESLTAPTRATPDPASADRL